MQQRNNPWPIFAAALGLTVIGFWPSFFAVLPDRPLAHQVHGWSATAWMLLPLVQYAFIRKNGRWRNPRLHRLTGYASVALAALVATSGIYVVRMMAIRMLAFSKLSSIRIVSVKFVWLDLTGIALFGIYVAVAIAAARRRDFRTHIASLIASAFIPLEAALERVFTNLAPSLVPDFDTSLYASLTVLEAACAAIILLEWRTGGRPSRVGWPMPVLLAYYLVMHATLSPLAASKSLQNFSEWFATAAISFDR